MTARADDRVLALCGGVGGAKLALGLDRILGDRLTVVVNTGDDFEHLGLHVSPDLDTVMYVLAGIDDPVRGWGRAGETWRFMAALGELGAPTWFALGDADLAVHVERTRRLRAGDGLAAIVADMASRLGVAARIVPMSEQRVRTVIDTPEGRLPFQEYFVRRRCAPAVSAIAFDGAAQALPAQGLLDAVADPRLTAIVICPSNPYLSIDPILAVPGIRDALRSANAPVVAVSPIVAGKAVKGPTAKIMAELGIPVSNASIAAHYAGLLDALVVDDSDSTDAGTPGVATNGIAASPVATTATRTLLATLDDRIALARHVLQFAATLGTRRSATSSSTPWT